MNDITAHARQRLLERRLRILGSLERARHATAADPLDRAPPASPATESLASLARGELAAIEEALARIDRNAYGECVECGGAIGGQRLRAIPEARLCVECTSKDATRH